MAGHLRLRCADPWQSTTPEHVCLCDYASITRTAPATTTRLLCRLQAHPGKIKRIFATALIRHQKRGPDARAPALCFVVSPLKRGFEPQRGGPFSTKWISKVFCWWDGLPLDWNFEPPLFRHTGWVSLLRRILGKPAGRFLIRFLML